MAIRSCLVCVQGIRKPDGTLLTEDILLMCFENPRIGGKISRITIEEAWDRAWITYADSSSVDKVLEKKLYDLYGCELIVTQPETVDGVTEKSITTVLVENVTISEDMLEILIEHSKKGIEMDGSITSIDIDHKSGVATVNLSAESDAQKLLSKKFLEYKTTRMMVRERPPAHPSAVLVTGICEAVDEDTMELYFSNPKKSGGDDIVEIKFFEPENNFAVVIFADVTAAEAVIRKKFHYVRQRELLASQWFPGEEKNLQVNKPGKSQRGSWRGSLSKLQSIRSSVSSQGHLDKSQEDENGDEVEIVEVKSCAILVEGLPEKTKEETIRRFFQSRTMSGGGPLESVSQRNIGTYIVVFKERGCVDRVLKRDNLTLENNVITVKEMKSPVGASDVQGPTEPFKVFVFGDLTKLTRDALILYLEEVASATVSVCMYGIRDGVAMITFAEKFDYKALRRETPRKPVEDVMLCVSRVVCSSIIQVWCVRPVGEFSMKLYFESEKYSGGSGEVQVEKFGETFYLIHFQNSTVAQRVAWNKHRLEDTELKVAIYHEPLGFIPPGYDTSKPPMKIPTGKIIKVDPLIVKYVRRVSGVAESVNDMLAKSHGQMDPAQQNVDEILIKCDLKEDMEDIRSLAEMWDTNISNAMQTFLCAFDKASVPCLPKYWQQIYGRLQEYKKTKKEVGVMIVENEDSRSVEVVGPAQYLKDVLDDVKQICQEVQEIQESVVDEIEDSTGRLEVLKKMGMEDKIKKDWPKVSAEVDEKAEKIILHGKPTEILQAIKYLHKQLRVIEEHDVPLTKLQMKVISSKSGWEHIDDILKKKNFICKIECYNEKVTIIGPKDQVQTTEVLLKDGIIESSMMISKESRPAFRGKEWDQFIQMHLKDNEGKLQVEMAHDLSSIKIATFFDQYDQFKETLVNYLKANTIKKRFIPAKRGYVKLLDRHCQKDLKQIEMDFISSAVIVQSQQDGDQSQDYGFTVSGMSDGVDQAVTRVKALIMSVVSESQLICQPGLPKFLKSEGSTMIVCGVENMYEVVIEVNDAINGNSSVKTLLEADPRKPVMTVLKSINTEDGVTIKVILGDLTEHTVDAVVNAANQKLRHGGGLAGALVMKGGKSIQQESNEFIQRFGSLQAGDAMVTGAGSLPCKRIIHTVGPHWSGGRQGEEDIIYDCVCTCLDLAQREHLQSIAFPAIGSGIFGVPIDVATGSIVEAVFDFLNGEKDCVKEVHLVDTRQDVTASFAAALKDKFVTTNKSKCPQPDEKQTTGKDNLSTVPPTDKEGAAAAIATVDTSSLTTKEGIKITLIKDKITKQTADAIANSVPPNLKLSSGILSNSIMAAMDDDSKEQVQAEASQKNHGLGFGDVVTTGAGNLNCKRIFHIILPYWNGNPVPLQTALSTILLEAHQSGFKTLAIPAVGTGNLTWPADLVASTFFDAVIKFSSDNPQTQLKTINFVIHPSDAYSIAGFEGWLQTQGKPVVSVRRAERKFAVNHDLEEYAWKSRETGGRMNPSGVDLGRELSAGTDGDKDVGEVQIEKITLQVTTGDITQETTDAIVNSSQATLDVFYGAVSQALAKAGGEEFVKACQDAGGVQPNQVQVTAAGNLKCKFVIHFDAWSVNGNWKNIIKMCLQAAETQGLQSVAFPALGTGAMHKKPEDMAACLMEAIAEFAKGGSTNVSLVRVVIYQTTMLTPYFTQMEAVSLGKPSLWGKFKKFIGYGSTRVKDNKPAYYTVETPLAVSLDIYALDKLRIDKAFEAIDRQWTEQNADQILGGTGDPKLRDLIKNLDTNQKEKIGSMGLRNDVRVTVDAKRKAAQIRIQGQLKEASVVESHIRRYLHQIEMEEHEKEEAQLLCQFVLWEFEDRPGVFVPYPEEMNRKIEKAYVQKKGRITWMEEEDAGQKKITLDLKNLTENDTKSTNRIRRRDLSQKLGNSLPDSWSPMKQGDRFIKVKLNTTDQEYKDVAWAFQRTSKRTILEIERLQNPTLYRRYIVHKMDMEAEKPNITVERKLWHGTSQAASTNINANGFNRSYNGVNGTSYGQGVYFARDASYSERYTHADSSGCHFMYYANVLTGEFCLGNTTMVEPPAKDPTKPNILYDATVNDSHYPSIFVVYYDTQVYPHYLVTFRR